MSLKNQHARQHASHDVRQQGFWLAEPEDAAGVARCLALLADDLGDGEIFASSAETIARHGFGPCPLFYALLSGPRRDPDAMALFFPHFSTTRGAPGAYVQDLWVAEPARGRRIGQALLAEVACFASEQWQATYLMLSVHHDNPAAARFYQRLGFELGDGFASYSLTGNGFATLTQTRGVRA